VADSSIITRNTTRNQVPEITGPPLVTMSISSCATKKQLAESQVMDY
jgi:hypothetical protein